jgi:hypothetical protein
VLASLPTGGAVGAFTFAAPRGAFYVRVHAVADGVRSVPSNEIRLFVDQPIAIDLPILLRIGPSSGRGLHVVAGPSFNFNIGAQLIVGDTFNDEEDYKDEVEDIDVGLVIGAGYYGGLLIVEGRYQEGLRSTAALVDESYRNRGFVAMVGVRFGRSAARPAP